MSDILNDNAKQSRVIPQRFTRLFVSLLVVLTVLLTVSQALTQWRLSAAQNELWVIRYAALQRHQSQQIVLQTLQVANSSTPAELRANVAELRQVFTTFERYHLQGRQGRVSERNVAIPNSDTIQRLYAAIRPEFRAFQRSAQQLMRLQQPADLALPATQTSLQLILMNEKPFLAEMDGIVRQYTGELRMKLTRLQTIEFCLYAVMVLVLLGIGVLIFRPAARRLRETVAQLIDAESRTTAANKELLMVNRSLSETRQQLFEATRQQYQQEINDQKLRTSYLIAGQEEERKRLSRELHDGLGQMLTAIKLQVEGLEAGLRRQAVQTQGDPIQVSQTQSRPGLGTDAPSKDSADRPTDYTKNLRTLKTLITQTIQETRTISNNLMPSVLSDFGIIPALKQLAEDDRSDTIDVTLETNLTTDDSRLDRNVEIMLYRVTQEALSNAIRHAQPSHIRIELIERGTYLHLIVSDDGQGFVPMAQAASSAVVHGTVNPDSMVGPRPGRTPSQGLHNMQERAKLLHGKLRIWSMPSLGTRIQVSIPYQTQPAFYDTY